ncbi:MAG: nuclear export factor [Aeromicrobium sp.]|nr:nuclear export factor [Aeromicrobium sp.]
MIGMGSAAYAHIPVSSTDAEPGAESAKLVFRVPTESETGTTTSISITTPAKTPFASVTPEVKPGWKVAIDTQKLAKPTKVGGFTLTEAVHSVTWTTDGVGIPTDQFDEFALAVGPIPDAAEISFSAVQTYSDGQVVRWDQVQKGDTEPEYPAPTLELAAPTTDHSARTANWLSGGALVVAVGAVVVVLRQNRRRA